MRVIAIIESELGLEAKKNFQPMQPGDLRETYADIDALVESVGFKPATSIEEGIRSFIAWYRQYYGV
jgi:UDP-glucuronate 4-epimerase